MTRSLCCVWIALAALPALGGELMTKNKTAVRERPDKNARTLGHIEANVKISFDRRERFWYHVAVKLDGKDQSGWVHFTDVTEQAFRSRGQLLAENRRFYKELSDLREQVKKLRSELEQQAEAGKKLKTALAEARAEIRRLKAELQTTRTRGK